MRWRVAHPCATKTVVMAVLLASASAINACTRATTVRPARERELPLTSKYADVEALLSAAVLDDQNWRLCSHGWPGRDTSQTELDERYPVQYAQERLLCRGATIVPALADVLLAPGVEREVRIKAAQTLGFLDDPAVLKAYATALDRGQLTDVGVALLLTLYLPLWPAMLSELNVRDWIHQNLDTPYGELCLKIMDDAIDAEDGKGGLRYGNVADPRFTRWFNRIYDEDLDTWLASVAPEALAFRNRELSKGYDPVVVFDAFAARVRAGVGLTDEGIHLVIPERDWAACRRLVLAALVPESEYYPRPRPGWEARLRAWYRANRARFEYDFQKHRFVVREPAGSSPSSGPAR